MKGWIEGVLFYIFAWSGSKLWGEVSIFCPDGEDGSVQAMHFATDEQTLRRSCWEMVRGEDDRWRR